MYFVVVGQSCCVSLLDLVGFVLFKSSISLLIFCLGVLPITDSGVLNSL